MIIVLGIIAIAISICWTIYRETGKKEEKAVNYIIAAVMCSIISGLIIFGAMGTSYQTYLDMRADYDAAVTQYRGAVDMYADYAVLDLNRVAKSFTDFQYQGYQEHMSTSIMALRDQIVSYNRMFVKKRLMDKNILFDWLVIGPDEDMKIINIIEEGR